ncbi:MAG: hypothetical protein C0597_13105 [Marinilabiliales bacterium]|nr:MAG: hypothetical protein C0597_13105 [Marinilabiliales bacterium]
MAKAIWNGRVIAESEDIIQVVDAYYFPKESINMEYIKPSKAKTYCFWKGEASYYDIIVDDKINQNAAWYYPDPSPMAENIRDKVAFWKGVEVKL